MISTTPHLSLTIDELERLVKQVEPAAFLVPPRLLRRVIKQHRKIGGFGLVVPHRKGYGIDRAALAPLVAPADLGLASNAELPAYVFLMARPDPARLARRTREQALVKHWQILFHLHIDRAMQQKLADGSLTPIMVRQRIRSLGLTEFAEIADVLRHEDYLLPPVSNDTVYAEFVAVYLTLRRFDPARVAHVFPALRDLGAVDALIAEDIDADAIYGATRLPGISVQESEVRSQESGVRGQESGIGEAIVTPSVTPASCLLTPDLVGRLTKVLGLSASDAEKWHKALLPVAAQTGAGSWTQEARFLYDLQSACVDNEHGIYTVDVVEWALSLGELPIKRRLPGHQEVAIVRHLRRALDRLRFVRLADAQRQDLMHLLTHALEQRERVMRERFHPLIAAALDEAGLKSQNAVEEIGRGKLIDELLDRVVAFGHFSIGNLRDAISRNQLKLPDLKGPVELVQGDPLIRLNRRLAVVLDGVYRRGEFYMRLLHRLSSIAFGTMLGRLLVLFLILPFGLAFFVMITPGIAMEEGEKLFRWIGQLTGLSAPAEPPNHGAGHGAGHGLPMPNLWGVAGLGVFFLLLFHVAAFRSRFFHGMGKVGHGMQTVFIHAPVWLVSLPLLQAALHNRVWRLFRRCIIWPGLMATNGSLIALRYDLPTPASAGIAAACFALGIALFNTRLGQALEETFTDWLLRFWVWFNADFVPGFLHLIMDVSRWCLDGVEQVIYTVDEWLRFRGGDNQAVVVAKAVLGVFWYGVTYVVRFAVNLLLEPQVNPIKHFPVVTVSHKVCLPMTPVLQDVLVAQFGLSSSQALALAGGIITGIPGIFGFMVWELKENWKLYAANRAAKLKPVLIGSHGETMLRLLHPGFHSGTVPKLYQRLRRAERRDQQRTVRKITAALDHVSESVAHFVERELLVLLRHSRFGLTIELDRVSLATNRVLVALRCPSPPTPLPEGEGRAGPLVLSFDHYHGWLLAGVVESGWLPHLNAEQRQTFALGLAGLYKLAGVHLTRELLGASLPPTTFAFTITDAGLVVWPTADAAHDTVYHLSTDGEMRPTPRNDAMPVLDATRLLFSEMPLSWPDWVRAWQGGGDGLQALVAAVMPRVQ